MSNPKKSAVDTEIVNPAEHSKDDVILKNNRQAHRISIELEVTVSGAHNFFHGITEDISQGGLFIATSQLYPIGTPISLSLLLDGVELNDIQAEVVWVREEVQQEGTSPRGMGVRFVSILPEYLHKIREFLHKKEPLFFELDD